MPVAKMDGETRASFLNTAQARKRELEGRILSLIEEYEVETGLKVMDVRFDRVWFTGGGSKPGRLLLEARLE